MAAGEVFVLDLKQVYNMQYIHNIFTYQSLEDDSAVGLSLAFIEDVLPKINTIQSPNILNVSIKTYNLGNLGDNDERTLGFGGSNAGVDMLPLHDAINYTLKSTTRAVRPGSKRFSGIPEAYSTNGTIDDPAYLAQLEALRVAIGIDIGVGADPRFQPVIVKRVKYNPNPLEPLHFAYRFPVVGETPVVGSLSAVLFQTKVSHQVSR